MRIRFKRTPAGAHAGLEIQAAAGNITTVRFRSAMLPEMLDGIAYEKYPSTVVLRDPREIKAG